MVKVERSHIDSSSSEEDNSSSVETFRCNICQDVMIDPTSVTCGHTFCRLCLARWSLTRNQPVCAVCQQHWSGLPKVNITLRDAIKESLPDTYAEREREHSTQSAIIRRFDDLVSGLVQRERQMVQEQSRNRAEHEYIMYVMKNILPYVGLSLVIIVCYNWFQSGGALVKKPVLTWTELDCLQWLELEGEWTGPVQEEFKQHQVDGVYLLAISRRITKVNVQSLTENVHSQEHRQQFQDAMSYIKDTGSVPPSNFWEYKDVYILKTTWTVAFASLCPRIVAFYLYLFDYEASFVPAVNITSYSGATEGSINKYSLSMEPPSGAQVYWFMLKLVLCPPLVYAQITQAVIWENSPLAALALLIQCVCYLYLEMDLLFKFVEFQWARVELLKDAGNNLYRFHYTSLIFVVLYYFVPSSVTNVLFSVMFFNCVYFRITELVASLGDAPRHLTGLYGYLRAHDAAVIKTDAVTLCRNKINRLKEGSASLVNSVRNIQSVDLGHVTIRMGRVWRDGVVGKLNQTVIYLRTNGLRDGINFCNNAYGYGLYIRTRLLNYLPNH